ncbi:MAG: hypothetical protein ACRDJG_12410, partial [Actinomycetota bacterium]
LAGPLGLAEKEAADQSMAIEAVKRRLGAQSRFLLIFDNASEPKELSPYLPQGGAGHVAGDHVKSRNPNWRGVARTLSEILGTTRLGPHGPPSARFSTPSPGPAGMLIQP